MMRDDPETLARMSNLSFLEELDEAAAKLDSELKAITEVENHNNTSLSCCDASQLYDDEDDDELTDELASLEYSKLALQHELNLSTFSFEEFAGAISPLAKVPELQEEEMEEASEMNSHISMHEENETMISDLHASFDDLPLHITTDQLARSITTEQNKHRLNIDISPIKPAEKEEDDFTCTTTSRTSGVDSNTHHSSAAASAILIEEEPEDVTPKMQNTSVFSAIHVEEDRYDLEDVALQEDLEEDEPPPSSIASPKLASSLKLLEQVTSPTPSESDEPTLIPTYSEDSEDEEEPPTPLHQELPQETASSSQDCQHSSQMNPKEKKKKWLPRRLFSKDDNNNPSQPISSVKTNTVVEDKKRKRLFSKSKRLSRPTFTSTKTATQLSTVSENMDLPPSTVALPSTNTSTKTKTKKKEKRSDQVLLTPQMYQALVATETSFEETPNPLLILDNRERLVVSKMMKMLHAQQAKNKDQEKRELKLLHMLRDSWHDKKKLLADHKKEIQHLEVKNKDAFDNYQVLQQENDLLLLQTNAWKEISRQSNHQVAEYKHSYEELHIQISTVDQADEHDKEEVIREDVPHHQEPQDNATQQSLEMELSHVRQEYEVKLAQVNKEKEQFEKELRGVRSDHQVKLDEAWYQTELAQQDLEQVQSGYEQKFENYIREKLDLKEEINRLRDEYQCNIQEANERTARAEEELQGLKGQLDGKLQEVNEEHQQAAINFEVANIRTSQLEQELSELRDSYEAKLEEVRHRNLTVELTLKQLETKHELSNAKRPKAEQELKQLQDLLLLERGYHGDAKKSLQQQQDLLLQDNCVLKKKAEDTKLELQYAQENYVQQEVELRKERTQVDRLLQQASSLQALETSYKEKVEEANQHKEHLLKVQEELRDLQVKYDGATAARDELHVAPESPTLDNSTEMQKGENARDTLKYELQIAETVALRDQVERLKLALKASSSPSYSVSNMKSPVEQRIRDQVQRLRKSLTPKHEDSFSSAFWTENSPAAKEEPLVSKALSTKSYASMLRPKSSDRSKQAAALDKENNGFLAKQRRGGGLAVRTGLGIR